jgi:hypothetical protein
MEAHMTDAKRTKLVEKIRAMMVLAENPGATEEERDQAARTATKWIAKHQIEANELRDAKKGEKAEIVMFRMSISNRFNLGAYRADALCHAVVTPMGGKILRTNPKSAKYDATMTVFVSEDIKEAVEVLLTSLFLQMESGMAKGAKKLRDELNNRWYTSAEIAQESKAYRVSYLRAFGFTVGRRVQEGRKEALDEAVMEAKAEAYANGVDGKELANVGKDLVLVDDSARAKTAMDKYFADLTGGKKVRKGRTSGLVNARGHNAGVRDGQRADIGQTRISA